VALPLHHTVEDPVWHGAPRVHLRVLEGGRPSAAVYRRRRALALVMVAVAVLALGMLGSIAGRLATAVLGGDPASTPESRPAVTTADGHPVLGGQALAPGGVYVVQPGDTLWDIAAALQPDGDRAAFVDRLVRANGGPELDVGERIVIPG
jgi:hypothetical protein